MPHREQATYGLRTIHRVLPATTVAAASVSTALFPAGREAVEGNPLAAIGLSAAVLAASLWVPQRYHRGRRQEAAAANPIQFLVHETLMNNSLMSVMPDMLASQGIEPAHLPALYDKMQIAAYAAAGGEMPVIPVLYRTQHNINPAGGFLIRNDGKVLPDYEGGAYYSVEVIEGEPELIRKYVVVGKGPVTEYMKNNSSYTRAARDMSRPAAELEERFQRSAAVARELYIVPIRRRSSRKFSLNGIPITDAVRYKRPLSSKAREGNHPTLSHTWRPTEEHNQYDDTWPTS